MTSDLKPIYREALVVDNTSDTQFLGGVSVKIFPELAEISDSDLPIAYPLNSGTGTSSTSSVHRVPEKGSFIRVLIEDEHWQRIRYVTDDFVPGVSNYGDSKSILAGIAELGDQAYPQPTYHRFADGTIVFHNTATGESGMFHSSGGYYLFDKDGNAVLSSIKKISLKATEDVEITTDKNLNIITTKKFTITSEDALEFVAGSGKTITIKNDSKNLKQLLLDIKGVLTNITTPLQWIDSATGAPITYLGASADTTALTQLAQDISALLGS